MGQVLRGYAKRNDGTLVLVGTIPVPHSKDKPNPGNVKTNEIWSGAAQRFLRRRLLGSRLLAALKAAFFPGMTRNAVLRSERRSLDEVYSSEQHPDTRLRTLNTGGKRVPHFRACVTPAKIAREFGVLQSDVRKVLAGHADKL